ncbi:MAG: hypothetical protein R6U32_01105 [Candidatus Woesearchaeota archaeon]
MESKASKDKVSNENKLKEIIGCINKEEGLYCIPREEVKEFEKQSKAEGKGTAPIMTYGDYIIYLKAECSLLPEIPLSNFNYTSGTFEKKWGKDHKTIVLTPNHSSVRKVEIEIQGMDIHNMRLLPDKTGDVIEDKAKIKITRHYRLSKGNAENRGDINSSSPGETKAE